MNNQKMKSELPVKAVLHILRFFDIRYEFDRMPNDKGWRFDLTVNVCTSIMNLYDTGTLNFQRVSKGMEPIIERLPHAFVLYQLKRERKGERDLF